MPLSLGQIEVGAIVDWNVEWVKGCEHEKCTAHQKELSKNPIRRGMIVRVDGSGQEERVEGIWVAMGDDIGKDKFEYNGVTVRCLKIQARELNLVVPKDSRMAQRAWKDTFKMPEAVGVIFQSRTAKGAKPKILDALQLTGAPSQGPIADGPSAIKESEED